MATMSLPRVAAQGQITPRQERGLQLWRERGEEIERIAPRVYSVPSCSDEHRYLVDVEHETCSCEDSIRNGSGCKHLTAAVIANAALATCDGCGVRFDHRTLIELHEDNHDNLTYFHGDQICQECAQDSGVL